MDNTAARDRLVTIVRDLASEKQVELDRLKKEGAGVLARPDFLWHSLIEAFATLGAAAGYDGLIKNQANYNRLTYHALAALQSEAREAQINEVCLAAQKQGLRYPKRKAKFILGCFQAVKDHGGPEKAKATLLALHGRERKIWFLEMFPGIGPKYARNIMMIAYHEDFRDSIAVDSRIKSVSKELGASFSSYQEHEAFYLDVAKQAGVDGWALDRLLFWSQNEVLGRLN